MARQSLPELPEVEIMDLDGRSSPLTRVTTGGTGGTGGRRRRDALLVLAVVGLVVVGALAAVGDDAGSGPDPPADPPGDPAAADASAVPGGAARGGDAARRTTTVVETNGPLIPGADGVRVAGVDTSGRLVVVDLGSGEVTRVLGLGEIRQIGAAGAGVVAMRGEEALYVPLDGGEVRPLARAWELIGPPGGDEVWLTQDEPGPEPVRVVTLVGLDGEVRSGPHRIPGQAQVTAGSAEALYFRSLGGAYRLAVGGEVARVDGLDIVEAVVGDRLVGVRCDSEALCGPATLHTGTGEVTPLLPPAGQFRGIEVRVALDGRLLLLDETRSDAWFEGPDGTMHGRVLPAPAVGSRSTAALLAGDLGLVVANGHRLFHLDGEFDGRFHALPVQLALNELVVLP